MTANSDFRGAVKIALSDFYGSKDGQVPTTYILHFWFDGEIILFPEMPSFLKHPRPLGLWRSLAGQGIWPPTVSTVGSARYRFYTVDTAATRERSSRKMFMYLLTLAGAMVGASYAAVPLYRRFCQATGYGGTVQRRESVEEKIVRHARDGTKVSRELVVQFNADVADGMPWKFVPTQRQVKVKPGESALAFYTAENRSSVPITGRETYNVIILTIMVDFNKIQCFCFESLRLLPGGKPKMSWFVCISPFFCENPKVGPVNQMILSDSFLSLSELHVDGLCLRDLDPHP
ncbi:hypothetical protein KSP39_PZI010029 [Platanthera zijinensis]|uniref:Cytochrome c oxidase assembly protein COX11, mitochondrial n=1 Tax=Platanthera zijinensis TaxID=2320716 RepID=A0AAP0G6U5_9ASPA